jgi:ATP-dependent Lon protease
VAVESEKSVHIDRTIPDIISVLPLRGIVSFPFVTMPLLIGQARSIQLVDEAMRGNRLVFLVAQRDELVEQAKPENLYKMGTVGVIDRLTRGSDGTLHLLIQGIERARVLEFTSSEPYLVARLEVMPEPIDARIEVEGLRRAILNLLRRLVGLVEDLSEELVDSIESIIDLRQLVYLGALTISIPTKTRQEILEISAIDAKSQRLIEALQHEVTIRELGRKIVTETQERMTKTQRDYFLREQVRSIQKELGEGVEQTDLSELHRQVEESGMPEEARREANREFNRLSTAPAASPEHGIIRTYLEWLVGLPWNKLSGSAIDIHFAKEVLNEDHYDLDKIKDRILEYLAVKRLRQERQAANKENAQEKENQKAGLAIREPILCFVGPPGVGKTSLGQSIARALGRHFVHISLGGIHDEAEIRGHRRTYIGAMPGRIIQAIKRAETRDPVFMLDEIDKVGSDWRGNPSSALLEVLDPAQNNSFVDNYLGVSFDLSQVLFITTANTLDTIPAPLLDRMEVLRLSGYTDDEKIHIAEKYLIPKQLLAHGITVDELSFDSKSIRKIIRGYTREAGVRNLDREIATICRKLAREIAEGRRDPVKLIDKQVEIYLGRLRFFDEIAERTDRPGVATGLSWTPTGGDVLFVEATMMPSRQEQLILTGMLGDVMRESAQAALSYVRSNTQQLKIDSKILEGKTIHLHVPAGSIPKDGPSAGVTMTTALSSLVTGRPVRKDLAMTGEVTLRGKVLPVGGVKEKMLAAHRAGIKTVILPRHNERDLEDIPHELRQEIKYLLVDTVEEVLIYALEPIVSVNEIVINNSGQFEWPNRTEQ